MKIAAAILTFFLSGALVLGQVRGVVSARVAAPRVGNIWNMSEVSKTVSCGFYFQFPGREEAASGKYVFISQMNGEDAWMNLNRRDTRLKLISISPYPKERIGARRRINYYAEGGYKVRVETSVTGVSDENNYEPTRFKVTLTINRGRGKRMVRAVGYSGC
jgi:hypothetical protein